MGIWGVPVRALRALFNTCTHQRFTTRKATAVTVAIVFPNGMVDPVAATQPSQHQGSTSSAPTDSGAASSSGSHGANQASTSSQAALTPFESISRFSITSNASPWAGGAPDTGMVSNLHAAPADAHVDDLVIPAAAAAPVDDAVSEGSASECFSHDLSDSDCQVSISGINSSEEEEEVVGQQGAGQQGGLHEVEQQGGEGEGGEGVVNQNMLPPVGLVVKRKTPWYGRMLLKLGSSPTVMMACKIIYNLLRAGLITITALMGVVQHMSCPVIGVIIASVIMQFLASIKRFSM